MIPTNLNDDTISRRGDILLFWAMLLIYKNILYAISFMDLFAVGLIFPLFSSHMKSLGASYLIIGIMGSTYSGIQIISGPLIGSWSDIKDRKVVLQMTLLLCGICYLLLGFTSSIITIFFIRTVLGCLKHTQGICRVMISDLFPPGQHAEILSQSTALGATGFIVGPFLGGFISEVPNGFTYICIITSCLFFFNIFLSLFLPSFKSSPKAEPGNCQVMEPRQGIKQDFLKIISNFTKVDWRENWNIFGMRFLFAIATSLLYYNQSLYLKELFGLGQRHTGYIISFTGVVQTTTVFVLGFINHIFYRNDTSCIRRLFHFFVLMSASSCLLYSANGIPSFLLCLTFFSISSSVLRISTMELLLGKSKRDQRGTFSGVSNSVMSFARFITPVMSGIISDYGNSHMSILLPSVPAIAGTLLSFNELRRQRAIKKD